MSEQKNKTAHKPHVSKGVKPEEKKIEKVCENCTHFAEHKTGYYCRFPLPPQIATTGRVPVVHTKYTCGLFTLKG